MPIQRPTLADFLRLYGPKLRHPQKSDDIQHVPSEVQVRRYSMVCCDVLGVDCLEGGHQ